MYNGLPQFRHATRANGIRRVPQLERQVFIISSPCRHRLWVCLQRLSHLGSFIIPPHSLRDGDTGSSLGVDAMPEAVAAHTITSPRLNITGIYMRHSILLWEWAQRALVTRMHHFSKSFRIRYTSKLILNRHESVNAIAAEIMYGCTSPPRK